MCYRREEKHGEKREERERERDLWEEERPKLVTVRVWGEKSKGKREKVRNLTMREGRCQKIMFINATNKYNIYRRCNVWERDCFPKFFFGKQPIENKPYFYLSFPLTKDSFPLTKFFLFGAIKHWKMWKTIFTEGFPMKQIKR